jgi:predicted aconitase with swiveling domain
MQANVAIIHLSYCNFPVLLLQEHAGSLCGATLQLAASKRKDAPTAISNATATEVLLSSLTT